MIVEMPLMVVTRDTKLRIRRLKAVQTKLLNTARAIIWPVNCQKMAMWSNQKKVPDIAKNISNCMMVPMITALIRYPNSMPKYEA